MSANESPVTRLADPGDGATRLEMNDRPWGTEWTVICGCGYYRLWGREKAADNDLLTHECDPEQTVTVAAVWLATKRGGPAVRWIWRCETTRAALCAYCRHLGLTGMCPGLEEHLATQYRREVERLPLADVRASLFEVGGWLRRGYLISAVTALAEAQMPD